MRDDDHLRAGRFPGRIDRFPQFAEIVERFEHHQIDSGADQRFRLFPENSAGLGKRHGPRGSIASPNGPMAPATNALFAGCFARQPNTGFVDRPNFQLIRMLPDVRD